jgi:hypothetical protein
VSDHRLLTGISKGNLLSGRVKLALINRLPKGTGKVFDKKRLDFGIESLLNIRYRFTFVCLRRSRGVCLFSNFF